MPLLSPLSAPRADGHKHAQVLFEHLPCLQGADILAWSTCSFACETLFGTPSSPFAEKSLQDWRGRQVDEWLMVRTYDEEALRLAIEDDERDPSATRERTAWYQKWGSGSI